ncbi:MAG: MFS transporter [Bdellovibrio sp.]|nr:MFS transporter [Bdellovibrio sp.]
MTKKEIIFLLILATVQFCHSVDFMIMMPLGPQLMRLLSINPSQFGLLVSAYTFSAGIMGLFGVFFLDKLDRKKALQLFFIGFTVGTIACALANSYPILLMMRALTGAFGGLLGSIILSIVGDVFPFEKRGRAMAIVMAAFSVAAVVGVPFGLFLANSFDWRAPFLFLGILSLPISVIIWAKIPMLQEHLKHRDIERTAFLIYREAWSNPEERGALVFIAFLVLGQFMVIPYISPSMVANVGFSENDLVWIYLVGGLLTIVTSQLIGKAADRYGKAYMFKIFLLFSLFPILVITNMGVSSIPFALVFTSLFFVSMGGRMIPAMALLSSSVPVQKRGSFMGLVNSVQQFSAAIAAFFAGYIVQKDLITGQLLRYQLVGYFGVFFSLIALYCLKYLKKQY